MSIFDNLILRIHGYTDYVDIGTCYQHGTHVTQDSDRAKEFYLLAASDGNYKGYTSLSDIYNLEGNQTESLYYKAKAMVALKYWQFAIETYEQAAALNHANAMIELANILLEDHQHHGITINADVDAALNWLRQAAKSGRKAALHQLENFPVGPHKIKAEMVFAQMHETGEINNKVNVKKALAIYQECSSCGHNDALYRMGQIFEQGRGESIIDLEKSFEFYLKAAKSGHKLSLDALGMQALTNLNFELMLKLATVYFVYLKEPHKSATWLKLAFEWGNNEIKKTVIDVVKLNPELVCPLASLCKEVNVKPQTPFDIAERFMVYDDDVAYKLAYQFYAIAALVNHPRALTILHSSANANNPIAQFSLATEYWLAKKEVIKAIDWCLLATDQQYAPAIEFINTYKFTAKEYMYLASRYEQGETKDVTRAIGYYEKAIGLDYKDAAFNLGQFLLAEYNSNPSHPTISLTQLFRSFMTAYKLGRKDALPILKDLSPKLKAYTESLQHKLNTPATNSNRLFTNVPAQAPHTQPPSTRPPPTNPFI